MLNIFFGGEHHNELVETESLISNRVYAWSDDYVWTPHLIKGAESGSLARVRIHKSEAIDSMKRAWNVET